MNMVMTVQELFDKVNSINGGIEIVEGHIDSYGKEYSGQEPLYDVINLLNEYRDFILDTRVNI